MLTLTGLQECEELLFALHLRGCFQAHSVKLQAPLILPMRCGVFRPNTFLLNVKPGSAGDFKVAPSTGGKEVAEYCVLGCCSSSVLADYECFALGG